MSNVALRQTARQTQEQAHLHLVITPPNPSSALAYFPDGRRLVAGSRNGAVTIWNMDNGQEEVKLLLKDLDADNDVFKLAVTRDGKTVICSTGEGNIKVWDVGSNKIVREWTHLDPYPQLAVSPDSRFVAVGSETVIIRVIKGWDVKQVIEVSKEVWSMSFSPAGDKLACGIGDGNIRVYDVATGTLLPSPLTGQDWIEGVLWSCDGGRLYSGSLDHTVRCWNATTGEQIGRPWTGHTDEIRSLSLSPDGSTLASASNDETVRFWNTTSGDPLGQPLRHKGGVKIVCFSPSGAIFATETKDGKICSWWVPQFNTLGSPVNAHQLYCITRAHYCPLLVDEFHALCDEWFAPGMGSPAPTHSRSFRWSTFVGRFRS